MLETTSTFRSAWAALVAAPQTDPDAPLTKRREAPTGASLLSPSRIARLSAECRTCTKAYASGMPAETGRADLLQTYPSYVNFFH